MPTYYINEFVVNSDFALPADASARPTPERADIPGVTLRRASLANVPSLLRKLRRQLVYDVGDGFLLEPHTDLALHLDRKGTTITVDCSDERLLPVAAWAFHAGLGFATIRRGGFPLHGAGLEIAGRFVALVGNSGQGKSTLAGFLAERGARFGSDDLVAVYPGENGVCAFPAVSLYPKLSREAVDRQGLDPTSLLVADYGLGEEEYYLPLPQRRRVVNPAPLAAIFLLAPLTAPACVCGGCGSCQCARADENRPEGVEVRHVPASEAVHHLAGLGHAWELVGKWLDTNKRRDVCAQIAAQVPVYELRYVRTFDVLPAVEAAICSALETTAL